MHVTTKESQHSKKVSALEMCIRHININANKHFPGQLCSTLFYTLMGKNCNVVPF